MTPGIQEPFKNTLAERLHEPRIPVSQWRGSSNRYKIKLRAAGLRPVVEVRDRNAAYRQADQR